MNSDSKWAIDEYVIACRKLRKTHDDIEEYDYARSSLQAALCAYKSIMQHDEMSSKTLGTTHYIFNRLIDGLPLSPIEADEEDIWDTKSGRCLRYSFLTRLEKPYGYSYRDVNRIICYDRNSNTTFFNAAVLDIIDSVIPITLPYFPTGKKIKVDCGVYKFGNNEFISVFKAIEPNGNEVEINRYIRNNKEISYEELMEYIGDD